VWPLEKAQRRIILAGSLAMVYTQLTMSPAVIQLARTLGATGLDIGILGALPTGMLFMQFVAAVVVNHLSHRRWLWMCVTIPQRLLFVPVAIAPLLWPDLSATTLVAGLILATAANHALMHFGTPLWMSWMGDYLPHQGLSRYWGRRHLWMQWTSAVSLAVAAIVLLRSGLGIAAGFALLVGIGAMAGVADILTFVWIEEPPVQPLPQPTLRRVFSAPFAHRDYRSFISYTCYWNLAAMVGAPFISLYLLDYVGMELYYVLLLWACSWTGGAACAGFLGRLAETFGHRPLLVLCTGLKTTNMFALLLVPRDPTLAFLILVPVFMVDAVLNAGMVIANNGFMLRNSPSENRSMFIAMGTALAGTVGGLTAIVAGAGLDRLGDWPGRVGPLHLVGYHVLFATSLVLRLAAIVLALRVREPHAHGTRTVLTQLIGATPLRMIRFPLGLYRSVGGANEFGEATGNGIEDRGAGDGQITQNAE